MEQRPVCLSVGGSDSCAGAGVQADLRVFNTLGVQGCSATTALTAQNPKEILHIQASSIPQFQAELEAITSYYDVACIKTGMLYDQDHVEALIPFISNTPFIVDPVLIASSGQLLFEQTTAKTSYQKLLQHSMLWTPNLQEAAYFLSQKNQDPIEIASALVLAYQTPVLLKGGHGQGNILRDIFCDTYGNIEIFEHTKQNISPLNLHGTGCRLASAIAAYYAMDRNLLSAIEQAHNWLQSDL
ncbi:hydroxymethylpyrimidine/phosphomethylpyrimidine kinase [Ghiorsea bivora]|uniref:hydroxymethylpyrimidine/phosphomethylpyrimidine kinase n=1 Tax=Ghiorsea bivora TaxID=1485545 RepID=UPI00068B901D|nr:hydroxymethylpyrimidine/phosphomethylpyrimidine kinase [Ghiorsea bivora]